MNKLAQSIQHQWFCGGKEPCACMDSWKQQHTLPQGFPTLQEQAAYWERKEAEQERTGGVNDFIEEEQQYSNYENHEL